MNKTFKNLAASIVMMLGMALVATASAAKYAGEAPRDEHAQGQPIGMGNPVAMSVSCSASCVSGTVTYTCSATGGNATCSTNANRTVATCTDGTDTMVCTCAGAATGCKKP